MLITYYTEEEINIINNFNGTIKELALLLNRNYNGIQKWTKRHNIKLQKEKHIRKYNLNEDFFKIWSKEMAYILGFIAADGCVINNRIHIGLSYKDKNHLIKIKKIIECDNPLYDFDVKNSFGYSNKIYKQVRLNIFSKEIFQDIINLGITPNKSLTLKFPYVPKKYITHFIRGYFDGDGSIFIENNKKLTFYILGTEEILQQIKSYYNLYYNNQYGYIMNLLIYLEWTENTMCGKNI